MEMVIRPMENKQPACVHSTPSVAGTYTPGMPHRRRAGL